MVLFWISSALAIAAAVAATLFVELKRAVLALWVCALCLGGMYLSLNAEYLAIVQWLVATLGVCAFVFFSVLLGSREGRESWAKPVVGLLVTGLLAALIGWVSMAHLPSIEWDRAGEGVAGLGRVLVSDYLLPIEILALTLFLVVVGAGVITRPERRGLNDEESP
ncbi:MAG: NADH-quinone oxidoreductase subunit J [Bdellovibrionales bacterium]|nr:NADH-quinone oxidoreductase subunit J [Bdellovibrionales bacterium]